MAITPGTWRCTSLVVTRTAGPGVCAVGVAPKSVERTSVCGCYYSAGSPAAADAPQCRCGRFAIGRCWQCQVAVCGIHSGDLSRALLCEVHYVAAVAALAKRLADAEQKRREAEHQRELEMTAALAEELATLAALDPVDAWLRAARVCRPLPWDDATVASWYAERAAVAGVRTRSVLVDVGRAGPREQVTAHVFDNGSTLVLHRSELRVSPDKDGHDYYPIGITYAPAAVASDGRILHTVGGVGWAWEPPQVVHLNREVPRFSVRVLAAMAQRLQLPPLRSVPTPRWVR